MQDPLEYFRNKGVPILDTMPDGWGEIRGATTAPNGYVWINNRKSIFTPEYRHALLKQ